MFTVPTTLRAQFERRLQQDSLSDNVQTVYLYHKWLRYYLDFCHKYRFPAEQRESLSHFMQKLQQKRQTQAQQEQAAQAIALFYELCGAKVSGTVSWSEKSAAPSLSTSAEELHGRTQRDGF